MHDTGTASSLFSSALAPASSDIGCALVLEDLKRYLDEPGQCFGQAFSSTRQVSKPCLEVGQ